MEKEIIKYPDIHDVIFAEHPPTRFPSHWRNAAEFTLILKEGCKYKIRDTLKSKQYFTETSAKILIYEMLLKIGSHVMQEHREQIGDSKFSDKSWNYIKNACSFIADHSAEDISQASSPQLHSINYSVR